MHSDSLIAGVDEVGRGPLAGPVIAAAVILHPQHTIEDLKDSKALSERQREYLSEKIKDQALAWAIGRADLEEIDSLNILHASLLAMKRAVEALVTQPQHVLVDGNRCPALNCPVQAIIKGDQTVPVISAASIIAKVTRDREMVELDGQYPGYGFARHKGYPTTFHMNALQELGISPVHRRTFGPVRRLLAGHSS